MPFSLKYSPNILNCTPLSPHCPTSQLPESLTETSLVISSSDTKQEDPREMQGVSESQSYCLCPTHWGNISNSRLERGKDALAPREPEKKKPPALRTAAVSSSLTQHGKVCQVEETLWTAHFAQHLGPNRSWFLTGTIFTCFIQVPEPSPRDTYL